MFSGGEEFYEDLRGWKRKKGRQHDCYCSVLSVPSGEGKRHCP